MVMPYRAIALQVMRRTVCPARSAPRPTAGGRKWGGHRTAPDVTVSPSVHDGTMATKQLRLIDDRADDWRLDEQTKEIGRRGLVEARAALQKAMRRAAA